MLDGHGVSAGQVCDHDDFTARWRAILPLYDYDYDPEKIGRAGRPPRTKERDAWLAATRESLAKGVSG